MVEDVLFVNKWAAKMEHPQKLSETVSKNWINHHLLIKGQIYEERQDRERQRYF